MSDGPHEHFQLFDIDQAIVILVCACELHFEKAEDFRFRHARRRGDRPYKDDVKYAEEERP